MGGEVNIDASKISDDPQATIIKMQTVIQAALAPAEPSSQDRSVAAKAQKIEMEAQTELMKTQSDKTFSSKNDKEGQVSTSQSGETSTSGDTSSIKSSINIYA